MARCCLLYFISILCLVCSSFSTLNSQPMHTHGSLSHNHKYCVLNPFYGDSVSEFFFTFFLRELLFNLNCCCVIIIIIIERAQWGARDRPKNESSRKESKLTKKQNLYSLKHVVFFIGHLIARQKRWKKQRMKKKNSYS